MGRIAFPGATSEHRAKGTLIADGQEIAATMQCCHCGNHWVWTHDDLKRKPFCMKCGEISCGSIACIQATLREHMHWLERLERNKRDPKNNPLEV